jgi:hypothetical protein
VFSENIYWRGFGIIIIDASFKQLTFSRNVWVWYSSFATKSSTATVFRFIFRLAWICDEKALQPHLKLIISFSIKIQGEYMEVQIDYMINLLTIFAFDRFADWRGKLGWNLSWTIPDNVWRKWRKSFKIKWRQKGNPD